MRRFSQRSALVTLSEINITPLLDLAFVLLIIFVITTPLLENALPLKLAKGGQQLQRVEPRDIRTVEIDPRGIYFLNRQRMSLEAILANLIKDFRANPNLVVRIRADENGRNKELYAVIDGCRRNGITRMDLQTEPPIKR
ncbi:MAG TPA: biopolymer transporter ExbD [Candidatus Binatia bacterium]|jgi:biopolymer transport protein ExbD|nr:biopolymer transporter ExbD [Candidatus Binatia bacterium]